MTLNTTPPATDPDGTVPPISVVPYSLPSLPSSKDCGVCRLLPANEMLCSSLVGPRLAQLRRSGPHWLAASSAGSLTKRTGQVTCGRYQPGKFASRPPGLPAAPVFRGLSQDVPLCGQAKLRREGWINHSTLSVHASRGSLMPLISF